MIEKFGIGIDIVSIDDFKKMELNKNIKFYRSIFLESELDYCKKFKNPYIRFAGKFAIKEAVKKSIKHNVSMLNIETCHSNSKPIVKLVNSKDRYIFLVSLSHEKEYAIAVVISEKI